MKLWLKILIAMLLGVATGAILGENATVLKAHRQSVLEPHLYDYRSSLSSLQSPWV